MHCLSKHSAAIYATIYKPISSFEAEFDRINYFWGDRVESKKMLGRLSEETKREREREREKEIKVRNIGRRKRKWERNRE